MDQSAEALARGAHNASLNGLANIAWREANAFDLLRDFERAGERFDTIVLDPPAFAKTRATLPRALAGYKEINLRAMRLLAPDGYALHLLLLLPRAPGRFPRHAGGRRRRQRSPSRAGPPRPAPPPTIPRS